MLFDLGFPRRRVARAAGGDRPGSRGGALRAGCVNAGGEICRILVQNIVESMKRKDNRCRKTWVINGSFSNCTKTSVHIEPKNQVANHFKKAKDKIPDDNDLIDTVEKTDNTN